MDDLHRELAPVSDAAWTEIEDEARRTVKLALAGRKVVDFDGPRGWDCASVSLGRTEALAQAPAGGIEARLRRVQPLVELRAPFTLRRDELESVARGGRDPDLKPVTDAARTIAAAEDHAIFHGYPAGGIKGIAEGAAHATLALSDDYERYPKVVAEALSHLRHAGVAGPYAIALGPRCYKGLTETTTAGGMRVFDHVRNLLDGPVVWAPAVNGAVIASMRGGDFVLTVGQDLSIGYLGHDADTVTLYLQESMTFRVLSGEAAVPLSYQAQPRAGGRRAARGR